MDTNPSDDQLFEFNEASVQRLKDKYSKELKDDANNPIKVCMKLIFEAAIEKNPQKRSELACDLSRFLTKSDGVINLFLALIDFDTTSQKITTHNQRFIAVSNIITCLPKLCLPHEEYYENISRQLYPLLIHENSRYSTLASIIIKSMLESPYVKTDDIAGRILGPIFEGLSANSVSKFTPHSAIIAVNNLLHHRVNSKLFISIFPNLFYSLIMLHDTPSPWEQYLRTSLVSILDGLEPGPACCLIENTLYYNERKSLYTIHADEDGVSLKVHEALFGDEDPGITIDFDKTKKLIISLLERCDNQLLVLEFFFHFQEVIWSTNNEERIQKSASLIEPLLSQTIQEDSGSLDLLSSIANNSERALQLISRTLLNYVSFLRSVQHSETVKSARILIDQSFRSCLNILEVLSVVLRNESGVDIIQRKCLPILKEIDNLLSGDNNDQSKVKRNLDALIKKLDRGSSKQAFSVKCDDDHSENEYDEIIKDLNDKLVPVRVHALVRLKQMVMANDKYTISRTSNLYTLIESSLSDQEPYVFLACINLLGEMSVRKTEEILPKLMELYSKNELGVGQRLNVGEVLVRLSRQMSKTAPHYAQQIVNVLFKGIKDQEELIRVSSLANLGEICRNLGDSLGKYIVDIMDAVQDIIDADTVPVKCAAVDLLRSSLMGLDGLTIESIQRELKSIYGLLKKVKCRTIDDKLSLQVDLTLDELDRIAREMLGLDIDGQRRNEMDLVKNIRMLR